MLGAEATLSRGPVQQGAGHCAGGRKRRYRCPEREEQAVPGGLSAERLSLQEGKEHPPAPRFVVAMSGAHTHLAGCAGCHSLL